MTVQPGEGPLDEIAWTNKGIMLAQQGNHQGAIGAFEWAVRINPKNAEAWVNKGNSHVWLGQYHEAMEAFDQVRRINPKYAEAWSNKGVVFALQGRNQKAMEVYDWAIRINPCFASVWINKGLALIVQGQYHEMKTMPRITKTRLKTPSYATGDAVDGEYRVPPMPCSCNGFGDPKIRES